MVSYIRTDDEEIRSQQWLRIGEATSELCRAINEVYILRQSLTALKTLQALAWQETNPDIEYLRSTSRQVKRCQERLKTASDTCSYLNSELCALQTALSAQEME